MTAKPKKRIDSLSAEAHYVVVKTLIVTMVWASAVMLLLGASQASKASPFAFRGIKGLFWNGIDNYRKALPWLAENDLNFLMLCYSSYPASASDWRSDYTPEQLEEFKDLAAKAGKLNITLCLSFNPGIWSDPPLVYSSEKDYQLILGKVKQVHAIGINRFALCLDDINPELQPDDKERFGTMQAAHVYLVNRLYGDMRRMKPRPKLIFCPMAFASNYEQLYPGYLDTVGQEIDKNVMMFWTGPDVRSGTMSAAEARAFGRLIRRKPFVWDNYPVNDGCAWRPLLAPLKNRTPDLGDAVVGYMSNPMRQWRISTIPLGTTAQYLNHPENYDPERAMENVIRGFPNDQQRAIRLLVQIYGSAFPGEPGYPAYPRPKDETEARRELSRRRVLKKELTGNPALKDVWIDVQPAVDLDIIILERKLGNRERNSPLKAAGVDFDGGAAETFGYNLYDRIVNYVYAKSTGRSEMSAPFFLANTPASARLRMVARDGSAARKARIRIELNNTPLVDGETPFSSVDFEQKVFDIPASTLKSGTNLLVIRNLEDTGDLGNLPWFMVAEAEIVPR
ncbi:MAG: beta-N-acetylglucosaminidase domain-containing protein [Armatimonadota bacterium]|nr:beta-N-acetylglucosaminidase domain-containing protein [Armatimonadota bacterium]